MSEYYEHANSFNSEQIEDRLFDLTSEIMKILYDKIVKISFTCEIDDITQYEILIEFKDNYLYKTGFNELKRYMENSKYKFISIFLSDDKYITLKFVRR